MLGMSVVVAFLSQKGGVGKSTLARALAAVAGYSGMRTRLADLDPQQASVTEWERTRERNDAGPPCEVVAYRTLAEAIDGSGDIDLLILDCPARIGPESLEVAHRCDLLVQPTGASADDLRPAILTFHELTNAGIPKSRLAAAICRTLSDTEEDAARAYVQAAGYEVLSGSIPERSAYREAQNRGHAITETKFAKLNERADALMEALLRKVSQQLHARARRVRKVRKAHE